MALRLVLYEHKSSPNQLPYFREIVDATFIHHNDLEFGAG